MTVDEKGAQYEMKEVIKGAAMYTSGAILGPLLLFGGLGMFLDWYFQKKPLFLLMCIGVAFIITNIFLFRRSKELTKKMNQYSQEAKKKNKESKGLL